MTKPIIKITAILGALCLFVLAFVSLKIFSAGLTSLTDEAFHNGAAAMGVTPSIHWIFFGFLAIGLSWYKSKACAAVLTAFGVCMLLDALLGYMHGQVGVVLVLLSAAGILLLSSGLMLRKDASKGL